MGGARATAGLARGHQAKLNRRKICPPGQAKHARCTSEVAVGKTGKPLAFPKPDTYTLQGLTDTIWGFGPKDFHTAYGLPLYAKYQQTIAIVLWGDDPTVKQDLDAFDSAFGLGSFPSCTTWSWAPCFLKVNQRGGTSSFPPTGDQLGTLEESLDVQYTHSTCLNCRIILVEADTNDDANLAAAENMAYRLGATEINNSWGAPEDGGCDQLTSTYASAFNHPYVAIVASSGDDGYGAQCPADLNTVIAVGGTDLTVNNDFTYSSEAVYNDGQWAPGSGCSGVSTAASWQSSTPNWSQSGCGSARGIADVSASFGGAWVYDSASGLNNDLFNPTASGSYWYLMYGTSLAAPIISGIYGLAGNVWTTKWPALIAYQHPSSFHDITSGSNGDCTTSMCQASTGYDGPTGLGTPYGLGGF